MDTIITLFELIFYVDVPPNSTPINWFHIWSSTTGIQIKENLYKQSFILALCQNIV